MRQGSGRKEPGEKKKLGAIAERAWREGKAAGTLRPAIAQTNCDVDADLLPARPGEARPRVSDWVLTGVVLGEAALLVYAKLRSRLTRIRALTHRPRSNRQN